MTLKNTLNSITVVIILTLAIYHLFIYFGRKQENYYLIFALMGIACAGHILSVTFKSDNIRLAAFLLQFFRTLAIILVMVTLKSIIKFSNLGNIVNNIIIIAGILSIIVCSIAIFYKTSLYYNVILKPNVRIIILMGVVAIVNTIIAYNSTENRTTVILFIVVALIMYGLNGVFSAMATATEIKFFKFFQYNYIFTGLFYLLFALSLALKFNGEYRLLQKPTQELQVANENPEQREGAKYD